MKNYLHNSILLVLMISVSITAIGQYTGTNPNIASLKLATVLDSVTDYEPSKAVDMSMATYCKVPGDAPAWLQIDLGTFHYIDGYGMTLPNAGELPLAFTFQGSPDGVSWLDIGSGAIAAADTYGYDLTFPDVYRFVRIYMTSKDVPASFTEVYVYGYEILPPGTPLAMAASNLTPSGFTANWGAMSGATGYSLDVSPVPDFSSYVTGYENLDVGYAFSYDVTDLSPNTTYHYRVRAYNTGGTSSSSNLISVTTLKLQQTITFTDLPAKIYGNIDFDLSATASSGLTVSYASSNTNVATISGSTVTIVGVGTTSITASQEGDTEYDAATPVSQDLIVNVKELTVTGVSAADKVYDGLADAILSGGTLNGIIGTDDVSLSDATSGTFAQTNAGTGISVGTSMTLSGVDEGNYSIAQPTTITADITAKELTVSGAIAANKVYDATTDATISGGSLIGLVGADIVNLTNANVGTFAQSDVGTAIDVTTSMTLSGADAGNYSVTQPSDVAADITPKDLTVTPEDKSREACVANPDFTFTYAGFAGSDDATVLTAEPEGATTADGSSAAGDYDITVSGGSADNYNLLYATGTLTVTPDITVPVITVQAITIQLDEGGNATITPTDVVVSATDDCGVVDTTLSQSTFTSDDVGEVVVEVTVTDAAGNSAAEFAVVTVENTTGYRELADVKAIIYPNPTGGVVELELNTAADELKVMDMTGKMIMSRSNLKSQETIDLSGYSNGIYIFQLQIGEDFKHIKVIKK